MPLNIINHLNTIMYKIICKDIEITDIYVGKTTDFTRRKSYHNYSCNNPKYKNYNSYVYQFIRENGGWNNWDMIQIEKYEAVDMLSSRARERYWTETLKAKLNQVIPTRTIQEYYQENKNKIQEYSQKYYQEYHLKNKDKIKNCVREYRLKNKDKINARRKELRLINKNN